MRDLCYVCQHPTDGDHHTKDDSCLECGCGTGITRAEQREAQLAAALRRIEELGAEVERLEKMRLAYSLELEKRTGELLKSQAKVERLAEVLRTTHLHLIGLASAHPDETLISNLRDSLAAHVAAAQDASPEQSSK
jgi:hypothetical protein